MPGRAKVYRTVEHPGSISNIYRASSNAPKPKLPKLDLDHVDQIDMLVLEDLRIDENIGDPYAVRKKARKYE